jgi:hypothetical protein
VNATAVGFDDQAGVAPEEVRHRRDAVDDEVAIHLWQRQPESAAEIEEPRLQFPARELFAGIVMSNGCPQSRDSSPASAAAKELIHRSEIKTSLDFRLRHRVAELSI